MSPTKPITKVLVANRGEVAVRILRTCREMGLATVAVYSDGDRGAAHLLHADEAVPLGAAASSEGALPVDRVVDAAKRTGADAIHPGCGSLAERPELARALERAGIAFVGAGADTLEALALETAARRRMRDAGVPTVAGSEGLVADEADARALADALGYPITIRPVAAAGGDAGWRCERPEEVAERWRAAQQACRAASGEARLYLEKLPEPARHLEVHVAADAHGGAITLGESEGSVRRGAGAVLDEAPSCAVGEDLRASISQVALRAARAAGLVGAGTVEFLLDAQRRFHFLHLKPRLSEAHPVVEMTTGLDLVRLQLEIARGGRVPPQDSVVRRGHAAAARVHAQDPARDFAACAGTITYLRRPGGPGVREDSAVHAGAVVSANGEPLLSKLVAWAPTRGLALDRLVRALGEYAVHGVDTDVAWLAAALEHPAFRSGEYDGGFARRHGAELLRAAGRPWEEVALIAAAVAAFERDHDEGRAAAMRGSAGPSAWRRAAALRRSPGGGW